MKSDKPASHRRSAVTRPYGGVTAADRRKERHDRLMAAGLTVFGANGFHRSTVRDVCTEAGLTERYFYESFKTLLDLFNAVYMDLWTRLNQHIQVARDQVPPHLPRLAQTEAAVTVWLNFLNEDRRRARILLWDAFILHDMERPTESQTDTDRDFSKRLYVLITTLFPDFPALGVSPENLSAGVMGALIYMTKQWVQSGYAMSHDEAHKHIMLVLKATRALYQELQAEAQRDRP